MLLVIDGFNLIYKFPDLEMYMYNDQLKDARIGLLQLLSQYQRERDNLRMYVFFDGKKDLGNETRVDGFGTIKIFYSHDQKADDLIKRFIKENLTPANLHIVTSDKEIIYYSKKYKCKVIPSEDFAKKIVDSIHRNDEIEIEHKPDIHLSQQELNYWYELFSKKGKKF